jgi:murein DD-endopeptidase MepM/ murein hydrolase activator NlpD
MLRTAVILAMVGLLFLTPRARADDIVARPVVSETDGVVIYTGRLFRHGTMVELRGADGVIRRYTHLSRIARGISPGVELRAGDVIGEISAPDESAVPF